MDEFCPVESFPIVLLAAGEFIDPFDDPPAHGRAVPSDVGNCGLAQGKRRVRISAYQRKIFRYFQARPDAELQCWGNINTFVNKHGCGRGKLKKGIQAAMETAECFIPAWKVILACGNT